MGGVRQQFATAAEVRLARESIAFFAQRWPPFFEQVGYLFLATTEAGLEALEARRAVQAELGVPVESVDPSFVEGLETADVLGAVFCAEDGVADPAAVARELVRRAAELGVEVRDETSAESLLDDADTLVIACGPWSAALAARVGVELPVRPLCRQLLATESSSRLPAGLPMVVESESGFHFRRRGERLLLAMADPEPRWGFETVVDESVFDDRLARLAHRFPQAAGLRVGEAWAGLYDMTPDAHPILWPQSPAAATCSPRAASPGPRVRTVYRGSGNVRQGDLHGPACYRPLAPTDSNGSRPAPSFRRPSSFS